MPDFSRLLGRLFGAPEAGAPDDPARTPPSEAGAGTALSLTGGGARAAYQAGVLRGLARIAPGFRPDILTGVSAGGLNATFLAASAHLPFDAATDALVDVWRGLRAEHVFRLDRPGVAGTLARIVRRPERPEPPAEGGFLDTTPLHAFVAQRLGPLGEPVARIGANIAAGRLHALAVTATSYDTGRSVTWVEGGRETVWEPTPEGLVRDRIRPEHVLASAALPFFFPAVRVQDPAAATAGSTTAAAATAGGATAGGGAWYGDGGIRLTAPLAPAMRLGADRILSVNTRAAASAAEPSDDYPTASRVLGVLMNAVFLDVLEQDAKTLRRTNSLLARLPHDERGGLRPVDLLVIRPSDDLARLAGDYEPHLPPSMRVALGRSGAERSPDWLSMLLFDQAYIERLVALGEADVDARADEIRAFLAPA